VREGTLALLAANARVVKEIINHLDQGSFGTLYVITNPVPEKDGCCHVTAADQNNLTEAEHSDVDHQKVRYIARAPASNGPVHLFDKNCLWARVEFVRSDGDLRQLDWDALSALARLDQVLVDVTVD
jgi:hypothetical protein